MTSNKFIADLKNSRFYRFLRHYVWAERRLWAWTLGTAWLVALVVYVSLPTEYGMAGGTGGVRQSAHGV